MANKASKPITIDELEAIAKQNLPQNVYDYYACGSDDQKCLRRNRSAFDRYVRPLLYRAHSRLTKQSLLIRPRVMVDVSKLDTTIHLFGRKYPFPIAFAPSAMQKLAHPQGEECVALAAHKLGVNFTLSSQSTTSLEDIAELMPTTPNGPERWFQLYMSEHPELSIPLIERAAGKLLYSMYV